ncbi:thioesterase [Variovorax paradoxus]|uniref:PaaI family thioesterase n=1 Tax=Comamonadaceae TaxID=80864 RepID=UPI00056E779F|nr:PaaI family thioesterase [Xenophilus azovorans]KPU99465.1 thioesterase [Variovorax paradoxus]MBN8746399.1 PaaI family thioesterase [Variovorax sp.]VTY37079.1 Thioesterase superfamily protein [Xylophilus ampelinus]KPV03384.1 thioesterase [Variovorax paradoxus]KPV08742.1 thioesterase [Variovorax paradoxus]|tara:strand:- start:199 stop:690 length:492 start_codon:yes stop_codon:yes gene_type:complete
MSNVESDQADKVRKWQQITVISPYSRELGLRLHGVEPGWCVIKVLPDERLVGNPATGVVHGGVITALLDSCYGLAIFVKLDKLRPMATLDLRIDYLKPATPGREIFGGAVCYKLGHELAFVRGAAYHDSPDDPIATSSAIFMFTDGPVIALDDALKLLEGFKP